MFLVARMALLLHPACSQTLSTLVSPRKHPHGPQQPAHSAQHTPSANVTPPPAPLLAAGRRGEAAQAREGRGRRLSRRGRHGRPAGGHARAQHARGAVVQGADERAGARAPGPHAVGGVHRAACARGGGGRVVGAVAVLPSVHTRVYARAHIIRARRRPGPRPRCITTRWAARPRRCPPTCRPPRGALVAGTTHCWWRARTWRAGAGRSRATGPARG